MSSLALSRKFLSLSTHIQRFSLYSSNCLCEKLPSNNLYFKLNLSEDERLKEISDLHAIYHHSSNEPSKEDVLISKLGCSKVTAEKMLSPFKNTNDTLTFALNIDILKDYMDMSTIKEEPKNVRWCLERNPVTFIHLLSSLKETGFPINFKTVKMGNPWRSMRQVMSLQRNMILLDGKNMPKEIFSSMQAPQRILDTLPVSYEHMTMKQLSSELLKIFFRWQFKDGDKYYERNLDHFHWKSITLFYHNIAFLKHRFHFDERKIMAYPGVLVGVSRSYEELLNYKHKICGFEMTKLIDHYPRLLRFPLKGILKTEKLVNHIHGNISSGSNLAQFLTTSSKEVFSRIEFYLKKTSLTDLRLTPNNIHLLFYFGKCSKKIEEYEKMFGPTSSIPGHVWFDKKYVSLRVRNNSRKRFIRHFLTLFLGLEKKRAEQVFEETRLSSVPDLSTIQENYIFLSEQGFQPHHIRDTPHILLYPCITVKACEKDLKDTKYGPLYYETKDFDKLLQLMHCKVHRMSITFGKIL